MAVKCPQQLPVQSFLWLMFRHRVQALRQFQFRVGAANFCVVHVSLVPVLGVVGEQKTKPTQHSVAVLRSLGLNPTLLACRSTDPIEPAVREKLVRAILRTCAGS